jgi:hypothetical protein
MLGQRNNIKWRLLQGEPVAGAENQCACAANLNIKYPEIYLAVARGGGEGVRNTRLEIKKNIYVK